MTVVVTNPFAKGRFDKLAHALFMCTTFIRTISLIYVIVGTVLRVKEGVLDEATFPFLNQFVIHGMPLGNLSNGLDVALYFFVLVHSVFGFLGLYGAICKQKLLLIIHVVFLLIGVAIDTLFIVLFALMIGAINSWIPERFQAYYQDYTDNHLTSNVRSAIQRLFISMECCGYTGTANVCTDIDPTYSTGCWDKYKPIMNGYLRVFILLLSFNICVEVLNILLSNVIYSRSEEKPSSNVCGMFIHFYRFVKEKWVKGKMKFFFALTQVFDMLCSFALIISGIVITRSGLVTDGWILPIFENLLFEKYYLPGIILNLGVTMIVIGILSILSWCLGYIVLCFKSRIKFVFHLAYQIFLVVFLIAGMGFWMDILRKVKEELSDQMFAEFLGYDHSSDSGKYYTKAWNAIFVIYSCCSVKNIADFAHTGNTYSSTTFPFYCQSGQTLANSDLSAETWTTITSSYYTTVCDVAVGQEIETYRNVFVSLCALLFPAKIYNVVYTAWSIQDSKTTESAKSQDPERSMWSRIKEFSGQDWLKIIVGAFILLTVLGVILAFLIIGILFRFDSLFVNKDIQNILTYIYIGEFNVLHWVTAVSNVTVSLGTMTFVVFCIACISFAARSSFLFYVAAVCLLISVSAKFLSIMIWIPLRSSLDWNLAVEMRSAFINYFKTDKLTSSNYHVGTNLGFVTLFKEGSCCGADDAYSISHTWETAGTVGQLPWTCYQCNIATGIRWSSNSYFDDCYQNSLNERGCSGVVLDRIHRYDVPIVVLGCLAILFEVILIIVLDRIYKAWISSNNSNGLFYDLFLNNRMINDTTMHNFKKLAFVLCILKIVFVVMEIIALIGIILQKFDPNYFHGTETNYLDKMISGDIRLGYITRVLGYLLLVLTVISILTNIITFVAILKKYRAILFTSVFVSVGFVMVYLVILGLLSDVLNVVYCCNRSSCSYRLDSDVDTFSTLCDAGFTAALDNVVGTAIGYVVTSICIQVVCIILTDRLYKRIDSKEDQGTDSSGIFSKVWKNMSNNRFINQTRMPQYTTLATLFVSSKFITMVTEFSVIIGIILQKFEPDYFKSTEELYLNYIQSDSLTLGYATHVVGIITLSILLLTFILNAMAIGALCTKRSAVMILVVILTVVLSVTEFICFCFMSLVLSVAYCCDGKPSNCDIFHSTLSISLEDQCTHGFQGAVYNVIGTFIGFLIFHLIVQVAGIVMQDRMYKKMMMQDESDEKQHGIFRTIWIWLFNNRFINQTRMPQYTTLATLFVGSKFITMVTEFSVIIGIILQKFEPDYFKSTEELYLNYIQSDSLTLGYATHVVGIITLSILLLTFVLNGMAIGALCTKRSAVMILVVILTVVLSVTEFICFCFMSLVLSLAYCCDGKPSNCDIFHSTLSISLEDQGAVYDVIGTFIGFLVFHLIVQIAGIVMQDRMYKKMTMQNENDEKQHGIFRTIWIWLFNNRCINPTKMPGYNVLTGLYIYGIVILSMLELSAGIGALVFRSNSALFVELDFIYKGTLYMGEMAKDASIVLFTFVLLNVIGNIVIGISVFYGHTTIIRLTTALTIVVMFVDVVLLGLFGVLLDVVNCCKDSSQSCSYQEASPSLTFRQMCDRGFHDSIDEVVILFVAYFCLNLASQITLLVMKDRLHKRIEGRILPSDPRGLFTRIWQQLTNNRFFPQDIGNRKLLIGFCFFNLFLMTSELVVWTGVLLQNDHPGYLRGSFIETLEMFDVRLSEEDVYYNYGFLLKGLLVSELVFEMIFIIMHLLAIAAGMKQNTLFLKVISIVFGLIIFYDAATIGFAGELLNMAYHCFSSTTDSSAKEFCNGPVETVFDLCGVFIGFKVIHLLLVVLLLGISIYFVSSSTVTTTIRPVDDSVELNNVNNQTRPTTTRPGITADVLSVTSIEEA